MLPATCVRLPQSILEHGHTQTCAFACLQNGQVLGTCALPTGMNAMASSPTIDKHRSVVLCCADRIMLLHI